MIRKKVFIEGMSCDHCKKHVDEALKSLIGIKSVTVDLTKKLAEISLDHEITDNEISEAISEAGYEAVKIENIA